MCLFALKTRGRHVETAARGFLTSCAVAQPRSLEGPLIVANRNPEDRLIYYTLISPKV